MSKQKEAASRPAWKKSERFRREKTFVVKGKPSEVFPLLCPVREYEWLPEWSCLMRYSESGVAEKNAVFETREMMRRKVLWTTVTYEPDRFIEYLLIMGRDGLVRLSISLDEDTPGTTRVTWIMVFTLLSALAAKVLPHAYSEVNFQAMMEKRESELNRFLLTGTMRAV